MSEQVILDCCWSITILPSRFEYSVFGKSDRQQNKIYLCVCRFYTLMVLSTALFGKPAFKNLICNGLVLAEDGKKMSKRLKNYPSPMEVINDYGAVSV